ncbi:MAG: sulfatase/phosphatase domain-containing protein, partial [Myxococcota bacterium]
DSVEENLRHIDELGSTRTYNHYCTGWAQAFCTPFKMYKRYANYEGGTADPLIVSWPEGMKARGEIRQQYCHAVDIAPTLYECLGVELPDEVRGYTQSPLEGESFAYSFDEEAAPTRKRTQFYSMLGTRGIWYEGWHASTVHPALGGWGGFHKDRWELFHLDKDRSQTTDLALRYPEKLEEMKTLWAMLAGKYHALPLDDRSALEYFEDERPRPGLPRDSYVYYPHCEPVGQGVAVSTAQRSYEIEAIVHIHQDHPDGVLFAQGSDVGGHTLYLLHGQLHYVYNWLGELQQKVTASCPLQPGAHRLKVSFELRRRDETKSPIGPVRLFIDDEEVGASEIKTQPGMFGLEGVITVGRVVGASPSSDYVSPAHFRGGIIDRVIVSVRGPAHRDPEREAEMARRHD